MRLCSRPERVLLGLSCLLAAATAGCQTVQRTKNDGGAKPQPVKTARAPATPVQNTMAKTDFQSNISKNQQFGVHLDLGKLQESQGNYEGAVAEYQKALEISSHSSGLFSGAPAHSTQRAQAYRRLAGAYDHLGRFPQAEENYKLAMKLAPSDPKVWNDAGYSYYMQGRYDQAERCLKNAIKLDPNDNRAQTNLGLTLAAAGKTNDALTLLSKGGGQAIGHANLAYLLASMGRTEEARAHYHQAIELQPQLTLVKEALAKLERPMPSAAPPTAVASRPAPARPATAVARVNRNVTPVATTRTIPTTRPVTAARTIPTTRPVTAARTPAPASIDSSLKRTSAPRVGSKPMIPVPTPVMTGTSAIKTTTKPMSQVTMPLPAPTTSSSTLP